MLLVPCSMLFFWRHITECSGPPVFTSARIVQPICLACELFMQSSEGDSASLYACSTRAHLVSFLNLPVKIHPATSDLSSCSRRVATSWLPHHLCLARPICRRHLSITQSNAFLLSSPPSYFSRTTSQLSAHAGPGAVGCCLLLHLLHCMAAAPLMMQQEWQPQ